MTGVSGVIAVVLAQTVAGAAVLTWLTPLWHEAKRSYFTIHGAVVTFAFALWAWMAARDGAIAGDVTGAWVVRLTLATLVVTALSTALLVVRRQTAGRVLGVVSVPVSLAALVAFAATARQDLPIALFQVVAGAAFLGAAFDGLFLGHWYLTDRKLPRTPINRYTNVLIVASVVEAVAVATGGFSGTAAASSSFNPLLGPGALAPWIAIGMAGATLLIAVLVRAALKGERASAVQSATGFYYLGVVTAFTAEIAVKTRFFPG